MKYDEFKQMCHKPLSEKFNYFCIDMAKNKNDGKNRIFNECKTTYFDCIPETKPFQNHMIVMYNYTFSVNNHIHIPLNDVSDQKRRRFTKFERGSLVTKSNKISKIAG